MNFGFPTCGNCMLQLAGNGVAINFDRHMEQEFDGFVGCQPLRVLSVNDFADRPARPMMHDEVLSTGK